MKKSMQISLLGIILVGGIVLSFVLWGNSEDDVADNSDAENDESLYDQEAMEVLDQSVEVVASDDGSLHANNLFIPWTINKNGNTFYLSQRDGMVVQIDGDFGLVEVQEVELSEDVLHEGQGGFLGFTLAPDFDTTSMAFAYHTYEKDGETFNRIVSLTLNENTWQEEEVLVDQIPGGEINNGGRVQVGPDGKLYATTGDTGQADLAQDLESLAGKILRVELDGDIPVDNPFEDSYVFSYGHRNSQGFVWDEKGNLYSSEHGESGHDEINLIEAGQNYGWPVIQGDEEAENMVQPVYHSGEDTWAPSGMAYSDGQLFIASLAGSKIFTYDILSEEVGEFFEDAGRLRDVMIEDGDLFTITNNHDDRGEPTEKDDRLIHVPLTEDVTSD